MQYILSIIRHFHRDSLYRNSLYLMMSTAVMSFFGFFFWIICARIYEATEIGLATTLISITTLISSLSLLGLNSGMIKYLPHSKEKNTKISTVINVLIINSFLIAIIYLFFIPIISPKLVSLHHNIFFSLIFIIYAIIATLNLIIESIYIALRNTIYVFIKNSLFSIIKLIVPFALLSFGAVGIFTSVSIASTLALAVSFFFLISKFNFKYQTAIKIHIIKQMARFSSGSYMINLLGGIPNMILPVWITNTIGSQYTAYFYMPMMIANLLYVIPLVISQSFFSEAVNNIKMIKVLLRKSFRLISIIILPSIFLLSFLGRYILLVFGKNYSKGGYSLLLFMLTAGIFISISTIYGALMKVKDQIKDIIIITFLGNASIFILVYFLIHMKLVGIGIALLIGSFITSLLFVLVHFFRFHSLY